MPIAARVLFRSPAHSSTLCENAAKSCICHRSENRPVSPVFATLPKTPSHKSFVCHTCESPRGCGRGFLLNLECALAFSEPPFNTPARQPCFYATTEKNSLVHQTRVTNHESRLSNFSAPTNPSILQSCLSDENRLCYTDLGLGKHAS